MSSKLNPFDLSPATSQPTRPAAVPRILMLGDKQRKFLHYIMEDKYYETIAFGGSRGGGKTMVSCMAMILRRMKFAGTDGLMLRRVQKAADMNLGAEIRKCLSLVGLPADKQVWRWLESKKQWIFTPNGNIIQLGYCSRENDWEQHQGLQWTDMAFEEANQFPESTWDNLGGSNRTANQDCSPKRWITFNPGGIGSEWTDRRFGIRDQSTAEAKSIFVKSLLKDSKPLLANDPGYRDRVLAKLPEWRRLQWEEGSFDAIEDAFFQVDPRMIRKQEVPYYADIWGGVDAGYFPSAFASVVFATWQDYHGKQRVHVMGEVKKHRLNLREQAEETIQMSAAVSPQHRVKAWYADPAAWKRRESETGANENTAYFWTMNGLVVTQAYTNARAAGWLVMRTLMENCSLTVDPSCRALINEMTGAMHDKKTEDIDERCEDHLLDALRYGLVSTAWGFVKDTAKAKPFEQFIAQAGAKQRQISSTIDLLKGDLTIA